MVNINPDFNKVANFNFNDDGIDMDKVFSAGNPIQLDGGVYTYRRPMEVRWLIEYCTEFASLSGNDIPEDFLQSILDDLYKAAIEGAKTRASLIAVDGVRYMVIGIAPHGADAAKLIEEGIEIGTLHVYKFKV